MYLIKKFGFILLLILYISSMNAQNCNFSITVPQDITICNESNIILNGIISGSYNSFHWEGTDGLYEDMTLTPTATVNATTTYTLFVQEDATTNLIVNGDFSSGNSGFTSDYTNVPGNLNGLCQGCYNINSMTPSLWNNCPPLDGEMMVVNGAPILNQQVWCQTVTVNPNSNYIFSTWLQTIILPVPQLSFTIDGVQIGPVFSGSSATCVWQEFFTTWQSGTGTSVEICITNQNSIQQGNDFALDNIFFGELCTDQASFNVTYAGFEVDGPITENINCLNPTIFTTLDVSPNNSNFLYTWESPSGNTGPTINESGFTFTESGTYTVTVTNSLGCSRIQNAYIDGDFLAPEIEILGNLDLDCTVKSTILQASSNETNNFTWYYPNGSIDLGQSITTTSPGQYVLSGIANNGCIGYDTVTVSIQNASFIYAHDSTNVLTCNIQNSQIFLNIQSPYDSITWMGPNILSTNMAKDTITVGQAGTYIYHLFVGQDCFITDSIKIVSIPPNFNYTIPTYGPITCADSSMTIYLDSVSNIDSISWFFDQKVFSNLDTVEVFESGTYVIQIFDTNGCIKNDSIIVSEDKLVPTFTVDVDTIDCVSGIGGFSTLTQSGNSLLWHGQGVTSIMQNPTFTEAGEYQLTVTAQNGCSAFATFILPSSVDYPNIAADIQHISCNDPEGFINLFSDLPNTTFEWSDANGNSGTSTMITSNTGNTYQITATQNGCIAQNIFTIEVDTIHPFLTLILNEEITCFNSNVQPTVNGSNFATFAWHDENGNTYSDLEPVFDQSGNYTLTLTGTNGCTTSQNLLVIENKTKPKFSASVQDITCTDLLIPLNIFSTENNTYTLAFNNQIQSVNDGFLLAQPGSYLLKATNIMGCDSVIAIDVSAYLDIPLIQLTDIIINCNKPNNLIFNEISNFSDLQYTWETPFGLVSNDTLNINQAGVYVLQAINSYGCQNTDTIHVTEDFSQPEFSISGDTLISCNDTSTTIMANFNFDGEFFWSFDSTRLVQSKSIKVTKEGSYTFYLKSNINGCDNEKTIHINQQQGPQSFLYETKQPMCFGDEGSLTVLSVTGGNSPYTLQLESLNIALNSTMTILSGEHELNISDVNGCILKDTIIIENVSDFQVDAGSGATININESFDLMGNTDLNLTEISSITWQPSTSLSCGDCLNPTASPDSLTQYTLTIKNLNGCVHIDTVTIRVKSLKGVVAPNIFIPGNSGSNSKFTLYPLFESVKLINVLKIYDRWGNLVFMTQNIEAGIPELGWNGYFNNLISVPGVYVWVADILFKDGSNAIESGDVTLLR